MKNFIENLTEINNAILKEKGVTFFALFSRKDQENRWDLVFAADWVHDGQTRQVVKMLLEKLKEKDLNYNEFIESLVVFSPEDNFLHHIAAAYKARNLEVSEEGNTRIKLFDDFQIEAKVIFENFDDFEIKTISPPSKVQKIIEPVF